MVANERKLDEYYQATSQRLYNYPQYLAMLNTAVINRDTALAKIGEVNHPISRYSERTAASSDGLTGPESYTDTQETISLDLWRAEKTINQLNNLVQPVSGALSTLTPEEVLVISLRFWGVKSPLNLGAFDASGMKGIKWEEFEGHGFSRRTAIRICAQGKWKIRNVIFPCRQDEGTGIIAVD
jgi:hypothetical protein